MQLSRLMMAAKQHTGATPTHMVLIYADNYRCLRVFFDIHPDVLLQGDAEGNTVFHTATAYCRLNTLKALVLLEPNGVIVGNKIQETPVHAAVFEHRQESMKILLQANPEGLTRANTFGDTPLHSAVLLGYVPFVNGFCSYKGGRGNNNNINCTAEPTTVSGAASASSPSSSSSSSSSSIVLIQNTQGETPMHYAVMYGLTTATLQALLKACPEAASVRTFNEETPLDIAKRMEKVDCQDLLSQA